MSVSARVTPSIPCCNGEELYECTCRWCCLHRNKETSFLLITMAKNSCTLPLDVPLLWKEWVEHLEQTPIYEANSRLYLHLLYEYKGVIQKQEILPERPSIKNHHLYLQYNREVEKMIRMKINGKIAKRRYRGEVISSKEGRTVEILHVDGKETAIRKTHETMTDSWEALVHRQLWSFLSKSSFLSLFVPAYYGFSRRKGVYTSYIELIDGVTLTRALHNGMTDGDLIGTLLVIHGLLEQLHQSLGFVHGDLHTDNIMLRGYGLGEMYKAPVLMTDDVDPVEISLPFFPTLIDFGLSTTNTYCTITAIASPVGTPLVDVWRLYALTARAPYRHILPGITDRLLALLAKGWEVRWKDSYIPPLPLECSELSHSSIIEYIMNKHYRV